MKRSDRSPDQIVGEGNEYYTGDELIIHLAEAGYVIVPKEPTVDQVNAAYQFMLADSTANGYDRTDEQKIERTRGVYRAMVRAAD